MRYTIVTSLALLAAVPAMGQHPPSYGIQQPVQRDMTVQGQRGRETVEVDRNMSQAEIAAIQRDTRARIDANARLCSNVLMTYPADHLLLLVKSNPAVQIHCGSEMQQSPVNIMFRDMAGLDWYRTHAGHRDIVLGEGPND